MALNDNDGRVKRTRKLIRKGLSELSQTKSITKITVKELTDLIEINRGTFYLHYQDINDLVDALEKELYDEFNSMISSITSDELLKFPIEICETFCNHFYEHSDLYSMLLGANGDASFSYKLGELLNEKVYELFRNVFPQMNKAKYDFAYNYGKFGLVGLIDCWFTQHPEWSARQVAEMWFNLTITGLWGIIDDNAKEVLINAHNSN